MPKQEIDGAVQRELQPQETVVWCGQPNPAHSAREALPALLFAVPWLGITGAVSWAFLGHGGVPGIPTIGILAVFSISWLFGLSILFVPLFAYNNSKKQVYAITNKRILIISLSRTRRVDSYGPQDLCRFAHVEFNDGSGDLTFAQKIVTGPRGQTSSMGMRFVGIPGVRSVETILRETLVVDPAGHSSASPGGNYAPISF